MGSHGVRLLGYLLGITIQLQVDVFLFDSGSPVHHFPYATFLAHICHAGSLFAVHVVEDFHDLLHIGGLGADARIELPADVELRAVPVILSFHREHHIACQGIRVLGSGIIIEGTFVPAAQRGYQLSVGGFRIQILALHGQGVRVEDAHLVRLVIILDGMPHRGIHGGEVVDHLVGIVRDPDGIGIRQVVEPIEASECPPSPEAPVREGRYTVYFITIFRSRMVVHDLLHHIQELILILHFRIAQLLIPVPADGEAIPLLRAYRLLSDERRPEVQPAVPIGIILAHGSHPGGAQGFQVRGKVQIIVQLHHLLACQEGVAVIPVHRDDIRQLRSGQQQIQLLRVASLHGKLHPRIFPKGLLQVLEGFRGPCIALLIIHSQDHPGDWHQIPIRFAGSPAFLLPALGIAGFLRSAALGVSALGFPRRRSVPAAAGKHACHHSHCQQQTYPFSLHTFSPLFSSMHL